ncbi:MAG: helix-turn-helix domain-containing protein [Candidatus Velamenicoccus archaeovorus]
MEQQGTTRLSLEIGRALRRARLSRGLTLRELAKRSAGEFKSTSVAGYERGERHVSVERFCQLAAFYQVSPARLLAHAVREAEGLPPIVVDLTKLEHVPGEASELLAQFVADVTEQRGERPAAVPLRPGDLEVLATLSRRRPGEFLELVQRTLKDDDAQTPLR